MIKRLLFLLLAPLACFTAWAEEPPVSSNSAGADSASSLFQEQASRFAGMYFAPMCGIGYYRLRDPQVGMVEFRQQPDGRFVGAGGWSARVHGKGETIGIMPPNGDPGHGFEFVFAGGEPVKFVTGGKEYKIKLDAADKVCHGEIPAMWDESGSSDLGLLQRKWPGRFTVFYTNPNRTAVLFASITLLFFAWFLYASRRWAIVLGALGTVAGTFFTALPLSRAGLLGLAVGGLLLTVGRFLRAGGRKRIWVTVALALIVLLAFIGHGGYDRLNFNHNGGDDTRAFVWKSVPQMMYSAPWGVSGTYVGRYYCDWFKPVNEYFITGTVINSHLNFMVMLGWLGAFVWIFGWLGGLLSLAWWVRRGGNALPLAMWVMFGITGLFNPVLLSWTLWLIPLATLVPFFMSRPWRNWRGYAVALAIGAVMAGGILCHYVSRGAEDSKGQLSVKMDGGRVLVNGDNPRVWIVDDEESLGWVQAAKEIRHYYSMRPKSAAIGYVRELKLVPHSVRRLVIAGRHCREYVELFKQGEAPRAREVIFFSPPFGVKEIPLDLYTNCTFRLLIGEFAMRYVDVYGEDFSPSWVITAPGSELYVPGWVGYALSGL